MRPAAGTTLIAARSREEWPARRPGRCARVSGIPNLSTFPWLLPSLLLALALATLLRLRAGRREELQGLRERALARSRGSDKARLQHPEIDLSKCIGCGGCVRACPEDGVLGLSYGQAVVVHGARCVGHGLCAEACPTGAIALTLGDLRQRTDLPALDLGLQAVTVPGLFLAGEITGFALVRTAVAHGVQVAREVARRTRALPPGQAAPTHVLDLLVVGAGPAGLAASLAAREAGLRFLCLEQQPRLGGTVAGYPRRKLVMTQAMELPLHGALKQLSWTKEELVALWEQLAARHELPIRLGAEVTVVQREADGTFTVRTADGSCHRARHVLMAPGRRGSPRRLGVPGEERTKVSYGLLDAQGHAGRRVLVVGGGDSAIEAALALADQPGTTVTLSYRKEALFRLKARNDKAIHEAILRGRVTALFASEVTAIHEDRVELSVRDGAALRTVALPNDDVFVLAGGNPPFPLLEAAGVSFDPSLREEGEAVATASTGLMGSLAIASVGSALLLGLLWWRDDYYGLTAAAREDSPWHALLAPSGAVGLGAGLLAAVLFLANLAYLLRRSAWGNWLPASLRAWMNLHVATGLLSLLLVLMHCAFLPKGTVGTDALLALAIVVGAGAVGRWLYAFVPRRQNGAQQDLEDVQARVTALAAAWDREQGSVAARLRVEIEQLALSAPWRRNLASRIAGLLTSEWAFRRRLARWEREAIADGMTAVDAARLMTLARSAHRLAVQVAHFEEIRGLLAGWRWIHRWLALLMVLLTILHVRTVIATGAVDWSVLGIPFGGSK